MVLAKAGGLCGISYQVMPAFANTFPVSRHLPMRLSIRHIALIIGIFSVLISFLFFGRRHEIFQLLSLLGALTAGICILWIILGKGSLRSKSFWVGVVLLAIAVDVIVEPYLIDTSYRIYLARHKEVLLDVNRILESSKGDVWVMNDTVSVKNGDGISSENQEQLLEAQKQLGVYMINKSDSTVYYGFWGFLDVRLGVTYITSETMRPDQYRHLTGGWYH
jgi:hypothetical protein